MTIVTTHYRYKRPPRKRKAVALDVPAVMKVREPGKQRKSATSVDEAAPEPAQPIRSAIVTAKNPRRGRFGDVPDMTPEKHKRRGDAADALVREMKRKIAASKRS